MRTFPIALSGWLLLLTLPACKGCGEDTKEVTTAPAPSQSSAPDSPEAGASLFSLVLSSKTPLSFSGLNGGVWVGTSKHFAQAAGSKDLKSADIPPGFPEGEGRVAKVMGRFPGSLWFSYERLGEGGKVESEPLFKLMRGAMKQIAEDWRPHVLAWSKNRILALSTSSGRLKIKVMEPYSDKPPEDMPGAWLKDESCAKSLKVHGAVALSKGDVFAAGNCKPEGGSGTRYVVIRWAAPAPSEESASKKNGETPPLAPSARGTANPEDAWPVASADAPPDAGIAEEKRGLPGEVAEMPNASRNLLHNAIMSDGHTNVWAMAAESGGGKEGNSPVRHLFRSGGDTWTEEAPLPPGINGIAAEPDGTLWGISGGHVWKRGPGGGWEEVGLPGLGGNMQLEGVWASSERDIWLWGRMESEAPYFVLRTRAASPIQW